jgi:hypothetical protein
MSYVAKIEGVWVPIKKVYTVSSMVYVELGTTSRYLQAAGNTTPFCEHNSIKMDSQKFILPANINEVVNAFLELIVHYS